MNMDQDTMNEVWFQRARENFDEALTEGDWDVCRAVLKDIEEKKGNTYELRRQMNEAMAEDLVFEPFEHTIPVMTEAERISWGYPKSDEKAPEDWAHEGDEKFPAHID